ncbi:MAG: IF-2-associated domain-containing protein, partial [Gammaproteobacteria bacterium]|nr:IF-2-associated domain-containing protein [Gammaproteobacteria bacterium]
MAEVTVKQLASVVGTPVERLLEQIKDAGLDINQPDALVSDADKMTLLSFLRGQHGKGASDDAVAKPHKIALKRKSVSEVKVGSGRGKVSIEVRRKRTIVRPSDQVPAETTSATAVEAAPEKPVELTELEKLRADQARREAERESERLLKQERAARREQELQAENSRLAESKAKAEVVTQHKAEKPHAGSQVKSEKILTPDELQAKDARDQKGQAKKPKTEHKSKDTLYGRKELHVATS